MALVIAMAMVLGMMSMTAFADDTTTTVGTATAKNAGEFTISMTDAEDGHTFKAYQIFSGSVDTSGKLGDITWGTGITFGAENANYEAFITALTTAGLTGLTSSSTAADVAAAMTGQTDDSETMQKVADVFYDYKNTVAATATAKTGDNYELKPLTAGYYMVTDEYTSTPEEGAATLSRNVLAVVGDVTAKVKNDKPTVVKKILDPSPVDANKAAIGDHVFYQITGEVPNYAGYDKYFYVINDTLSNGLTFDGASSVTVTVGGTKLTEGTDYVVLTSDTTPKASTGHTFEVAFKKIKDYTVKDAIVVTYSALVNENAAVDTGNPNTTDVTYSNNPNDSSHGNPSENPKPDSDTPTGTSVQDKTVTYTSEVDLTKYFDEVKAGNELAGATFTLSGTQTTVVGTGADVFVADANGTFYKLADGTYTTTAPHDDILRSDGTVAITSNKDSYDATDLAAGTKYKMEHVTSYSTIEKEVLLQGTSGADGKIVFKGLGAGTYVIKEIVTPEGYTTAADITFTIGIAVPETITTGAEPATYSISGVTPAGSIALKNDNATGGVYATDVVDLSGTTLPSTGGIGTTIFYVVGTVLVLGAAVVLITRRRMDA